MAHLGLVPRTGTGSNPAFGSAKPADLLYETTWHLDDYLDRHNKPPTAPSTGTKLYDKYQSQTFLSGVQPVSGLGERFLALPGLGRAEQIIEARPKPTW